MSCRLISRSATSCHANFITNISIYDNIIEAGKLGISFHLELNFSKKKKLYPTWGRRKNKKTRISFQILWAIRKVVSEKILSAQNAKSYTHDYAAIYRVCVWVCVRKHFTTHKIDIRRASSKYFHYAIQIYKIISRQLITLYPQWHWLSIIWSLTHNVNKLNFSSQFCFSCSKSYCFSVCTHFMRKCWRRVKMKWCLSSKLNSKSMVRFAF